MWFIVNRVYNWAEDHHEHKRVLTWESSAFSGGHTIIQRMKHVAIYAYMYVLWSRHMLMNAFSKKTFKERFRVARKSTKTRKA